MSYRAKFIKQVHLLVWRRYRELTHSPWDILKLVLAPILLFSLILLFYVQFSWLFSSGALKPGFFEYYLIPIAFWITVIKTCAYAVTDKSSKVKESMRMMGLLESAYFTSIFVTEGVFIGGLVSFVGATFTAFSTVEFLNGASFGNTFGLFFLFVMSAVPFSLFITSFFDRPAVATNITIIILLTCYCAVTSGKFQVEGDDEATAAIMQLMALAPPMALQIGCDSLSYGTSNPKYPAIGSLFSVLLFDIFVYIFAAWYANQIIPSEYGVSKHPLFIFESSYCNQKNNPSASPVLTASFTGPPTVVLRNLCKSFNGVKAVKDLSFSLYPGQIFALLGHNGAGKSTTINMLTGSIPCANGAWVNGFSVDTEMDRVREGMGVCPQHDVLFDSLTVLEHILLFAQLKGATYENALREALSLCKTFHLERRLSHLGAELSGGQKRKLSVAIAICGGSNFILLDEPTAGMDPLARRELWDLLAEQRKNKTILLTTHYMDECNVLGDRTAIINTGGLACIGSNSFLKNRYGTGYRLVCDIPNQTQQQAQALHDFVMQYLPGSNTTDATPNITFVLPFEQSKNFGKFFAAFGKDATDRFNRFGIVDYGVSIPDMEDVFLAVGRYVHKYGVSLSASLSFSVCVSFDESVKPSDTTGDKKINPIVDADTAESGGAALGIGSAVAFNPTLTSQTMAIVGRRLENARRNVVTIPTLIIPIGAVVAGAWLWITQPNTANDPDVSAVLNAYLVAQMYYAGYLTVPGACLLVEFLIEERESKLRNLLTVMGCDFTAFWVGNFIADFMILVFVNKDGEAFLLMIVFTAHLISFSYLFANFFKQLPNLLAYILYGISFCSPHGALLIGLMNTLANIGSVFEAGTYPDFWTVIAIMLTETVLFLAIVYWVDCSTVQSLKPKTMDPSHPLHYTAKNASLRVERLRKIFPSKRGVHGSDVVAAEDVAFSVSAGECFGLLGANGAGKSTTISMCTRHIIPTSGDASVSGNITQNNSLWPLLSVEAHLKLFARLRGVDEDVLQRVVDDTVDQMELLPHRYKQAQHLSGGMKRKLCVAISLIGDPAVVLLDEPSAGLDPKSRRNLWDVILRTMSHRAVVLTTHSLEEAEALCGRIAIMVKGQIRVLGTKQRLKSEFGAGFSISCKIKHIANNNTLIHQHFPGGILASNNGGVLLTYDIPREFMDVGLGVSFTVLEENKDALDLEEYTVSQPTMEQVFIRTVNEHSGPSSGTNGGVAKNAVTTYETLSQQLNAFLGLPYGTCHTQAEVMVKMKAYVNCHRGFQCGIPGKENANTLLYYDEALWVLLKLSNANEPVTLGGMDQLIALHHMTAMSVATAVDVAPVGGVPNISGAPGINMVSSLMSVSDTLAQMEKEEEEEGKNAARAETNRYGLRPHHIYYSLVTFCSMTVFFLFMGISGTINKQNDGDSGTGNESAIEALLWIGILSSVAGCVCCCCMVCCKPEQTLDL
eukprot:GSChrysophyteH1.ASY1.ANO1.314.1 assembled CDS